MRSIRTILCAAVLVTAACSGSDDSPASDSVDDDTDVVETTLPPVTTVPETTTPPTAPVTTEASTVPPTTRAEPAEPSSSPVVIAADLRIDASVVTGPFEVTTGADALGCDSGRVFVTDLGDVQRATMTCESGSSGGTFVVEFVPELVGDEQFGGPWEIDAPTDDFVGLAGSGEIDAVRDVSAGTMTQTFTGEIESGA